MKKFISLITFFVLGIAMGFLFANHGQPPSAGGTPMAVPQPQTDFLLPVPLTGSHIIRGDQDSLATVIWFGEYGDPLSQRLNQHLEAVAKTTTIPLTISFRHGVQTFDEGDLRLAIGAEAAALQGKFIPFHEALLKADTEKMPAIETLAEQCGLDIGQFQEDMANPQLAAKIYRDMALARSFGLENTPALLVNGQSIGFPVTREKLQIALAMAKEESERLLEDGVPADQLYETMLLRMEKPVSLSALGSQKSRHMIIPRHDFPAFGSQEPLLWVYYFTSPGGPFAREGEAKIRFLQKNYDHDLLVIFLPLAKEQNAASQMAAACAYWAAENDQFSSVLSKLNSLPSNYDLSQLYALRNKDGQPLCPPQDILEPYQELAGAAMQLKSAMGLKSDPTLLLNGIEIPVIREERFFAGLAVQELALATTLKANGLHDEDLLLAITRTPPTTY